MGEYVQCFSASKLAPSGRNTAPANGSVWRSEHVDATRLGTADFNPVGVVEGEAIGVEAADEAVETGDVGTIIGTGAEAAEETEVFRTSRSPKKCNASGAEDDRGATAPVVPSRKAEESPAEVIAQAVLQ
eukprot:scaffold33570_cov48-Prasinocladus_malaysianus.AAC.1